MTGSASIRDHVLSAGERLRAAGIAAGDAGLDARLLARDALGWDAARYLQSGRDPAPAGFAERFGALIDRRRAREPVAYIRGRQEFWGLDFEVTPAVLVPRPETELVVEAALELWPDRRATVAVADVGTGSGCLAVALARELPNATTLATDVSAPALAVARRNAARHGVSDRITFVHTDLLSGVDAAFDLIVANPPYVREVDVATLPPEVARYEPAAALFGGTDGLAVIRRLVSEAAAGLKTPGVLLFEFGFGQATAVTELISATMGLTMVALKPDLQGIPRTAIVRRAG